MDEKEDMFYEFSKQKALKWLADHEWLIEDSGFDAETFKFEFKIKPPAKPVVYLMRELFGVSE